MAKRKPKKEKTKPDLEHVEDQVDRFLESSEVPQGTPAQGPSDPQEAPPQPLLEPTESNSDSENTPAQPAVSAPPLQLEISDDNLSATIPTISPETTVEQVMALLKDNGVTNGISEKAIQQAIQTAQEESQPVSGAVVARGTPPQSPSPTRLEHQPPGDLKAFPKLEDIQQLLGSKRQSDFQPGDAKSQGLTVSAHTLLAVRMVPQGKPGIGVHGEPIQPKVSEDDVANTQLQPGEGIELDNTFTYFTARSFGYAGLLEGKVSLLSPIWIDADATVACYLHLDPLSGSSPPTESEIQSLLSEAGVAVGVQEDAISSLCRALAQGDAVEPLTVFAQTTPAVPPRDGKVVFHFPYKPQAGSIRADGSIDFRERNVFPGVSKDDLLAETTAPVPGTPGQSIYGDEIKVLAPANVELIPAEGTRLETEGEIQKAFAELDGGASSQESEGRDGEAKTRKYTLAVRPIAQIPGDVSYETGNIDFKGNVEIKGGIKSGFTVTATGDITVAAAIEDGAKVEAGGELKVQLGIVGAKTRVSTGGNVMTKFIQESNVQAGGDLVVGGYIHGGRSRAGGHVRVEGNGGAGGGIVGSEVWGLQGIVTKNVGSERSTTTSLIAGIDPEVYEQLRRFTQEARQAQILLTNLLKSIDLKELTPEAIQELIAQNPAKKKTVLHYVQKANQLAKVREHNLEQHRELEAKVLEASRNARINVPDIAYSRVAMRIGNETGNLQDDLRNVQFYIDPSGGKRGVLMTDLSGVGAKTSNRVPAPEEEEEEPGKTKGDDRP